MIDEIDKQLIELLQKDAQQGCRILADILHVSPTTVRRRLRRLIQAGLIRITAVVDPKGLGFPVIAFMNFDVAHDRIQSVMDMLAGREDIIMVTSTTGRFNVLVLGRFRSTEQLSDFLLKELPHVDGIRGSETSISLGVRKGRYIGVGPL
jgi:DNA-binding Lrp family transcriptional regulator